MNSARKIDPDVPSPRQFDHVISAVPERTPSNKLVFLDTTTGVAPFGFLTPNLRGKPGLAIPTAGAALLVNTPAEPPFKNSYRLEFDAKLSDAGELEAKVRVSFRRLGIDDAHSLSPAASITVERPAAEQLAEPLGVPGGY